MTTAPLVEPARATPEVRVAAPPQPDVIDDIARRIGQSEAGDYAVRVLVTASEPGRSAKSAALALARALSHERRAVLVDLDAAEFDADRLAAPRARALGLGDLMAGAASFAEVIHRDDHSRLHRIGAGALDLTHMDGFDDTLDALARTYHYVVLNAPAVSATPAALAIAPVAEFCVLVAAGKGYEAAFAHARDALQTTAVGEVLTIGREAAARTLAA